MSHIRGKKALNKTVSTVLAPFGISKAVLSDSYCYMWEKEIVEFSIMSDIEDDWFNEFINERFGYEVQHNFVISLLHEVGHHFTYNDVDGSVLAFCSDEKERIDVEMEDADEVRSKELEWQYFNLPDEIVATAWAVKFAKENPEKIEEMWATLRKALFKFYEENGLTE